MMAVIFVNAVKWMWGNTDRETLKGISVAAMLFVFPMENIS
jgi:hypothetical protein